MKKFIIILTAVCTAVTLRAAVIELDLSKATQYTSAGSATLNYADGELTVNWTVTEDWEVTGVEIPLKSLKGITGLQFEFQGDGSATDFLHYFSDLQGAYWWDPEGWFNLESTGWQSASLAPSTALWCSPSYEVSDATMSALHFVANPATPASGTFKLRNVKLITSGEQVDPGQEGQSLPLTYNGDILPINTDFERSMCGQVGKAVDLEEVSGIACSRVTPGYIWMQSDNEDKIGEEEDNDHIIATDEKGEKLYTRIDFLNLNAAGIRYWDWEDMCGGVYNGTNYLFIGAFGDNKETDGYYSIVYFEEPAITEGATLNITPSQIRFVYPDGKNHNCESLMYDNVEQTLYIITKVYYNVCQVFSLPFRLDYGTAKQTLTHVCDLGVQSDIDWGEYQGQQLRCKGFHLATAADISPDGKYVLIKNHNNISGYADYSWILYWERQGDESIAETVKRQPQVIDCYEYEWQGEAICWLDDNTFYTTSDSDGEPPIYKYVREATGIEAVQSTPAKAVKIIRDGQVMFVRDGKTYNALGAEVR